jgi:hypothetical protein
MGELGSCEPGAIQQGHEHGSKGITIVGTHYFATPGGDIVWSSDV